MKYLLKQNKEDEGVLCDKVTIDGFDYYVSDEKIPNDCYYISWETNYSTQPKERFVLYVKSTGLNGNNPRLVIATNNPNIDISKVVDEVERLAIENSTNKIPTDIFPDAGEQRRWNFEGFIDGYNKSQETHPFSEEDMIDFATFRNGGDVKKEFQLWKEQQPKIVYYES